MRLMITSMSMYFSEGSEIGSVSYFNKYDPELASTQKKEIVQ